MFFQITLINSKLESRAKSYTPKLVLILNGKRIHTNGGGILNRSSGNRLLIQHGDDVVKRQLHAEKDLRLTVHCLRVDIHFSSRSGAENNREK